VLRDEHHRTIWTVERHGPRLCGLLFNAQGAGNYAANYTGEGVATEVDIYQIFYYTGRYQIISINKYLSREEWQKWQRHSWPAPDATDDDAAVKGQLRGGRKTSQA
jgi:hypothetical protein